ncbi:MAG TPA: DUF692 domain-containing protein [Candidatus Elarobacter sp.]|jgi:hypothetical protein|nr:DUF692 domain-containing protein [Candidatus Elarobacter sp.]
MSSPQFGLLYRAQMRSQLFAARPPIVLELVADHYLDATRAQRDELRLLRAHFPITLHALGISIGSVEGIDARYVDRIARLAELVRPLWVSDHLAFTRAGGVDIGAFAPLPRTAAAIATVARNVARVRRALGVPFALENPAAPFDVAGAALEAGAFLAAVAESADCGLVVDVENLHADAWNLGLDANATIDALPPHRVMEVHVAGGRRLGGEYADSHDAPVGEPTWRLYERLCARVAPPLTVLERETALPPLSALLAELDVARACCARARAIAA